MRWNIAKVPGWRRATLSWASGPACPFSLAALTDAARDDGSDIDPSQPRPRRAAGSRRLDTTPLHGQALISVISALASFIDGVFEMLRELPRVRRDHKRKRILREMLEDPRYQWRGIGTLARSIGSSEDDARELLVSIGARASTGAGDELWGLRSRVGAG